MDAFTSLLSRVDPPPVLVDIGASGAPPAIWDAIAKHSIYVGFDPDLREIRDIPQGRYRRTIIVNSAVTGRESGDVTFYFTRSPFCSSTLRPNRSVLQHYIFSDLFAVEREATVQATTLDSLVQRLQLAGIDWFKADTQGTDLQLFMSLSPERRSGVLAVDVEPGLIDFYEGEDVFAQTHATLMQDGFWLSTLNVHGVARIRTSTLDRLAGDSERIAHDKVQRAVRRSPGWCEARYLRTIEWLSSANAGKRSYVLLWIFAMVDRQTGFALDLAVEYAHLFGEDEISRSMRRESIDRIRRGRDGLDPGGTAVRRLKAIVPQSVKRWLKR